MAMVVGMCDEKNYSIEDKGYLMVVAAVPIHLIPLEIAAECDWSRPQLLPLFVIGKKD